VFNAEGEAWRPQRKLSLAALAQRNLRQVSTAKKGLAFGSKESMCTHVRDLAKALPGGPLAPAVEPIRGSRQ
jgi:hypothetical protein